MPCFCKRRAAEGARTCLGARVRHTHWMLPLCAQTGARSLCTHWMLPLCVALSKLHLDLY